MSDTVELITCEFCSQRSDKEDAHAIVNDSDETEGWVCDPCDERNTKECVEDALLHPYVPPYVPERY